LGWPVVIFTTILGLLVAFVTWLAEILGDEQERQEQKWLEKSEKHARAKKAKVEEEIDLGSGKRLLSS
jgi:hypothetical protein